MPRPSVAHERRNLDGLDSIQVFSLEHTSRLSAYRSTVYGESGQRMGKLQPHRFTRMNADFRIRANVICVDPCESVEKKFFSAPLCLCVEVPLFSTGGGVQQVQEGD